MEKESLEMEKESLEYVADKLTLIRDCFLKDTDFGNLCGMYNLGVLCASVDYNIKLIEEEEDDG